MLEPPWSYQVALQVVIAAADMLYTAGVAVVTQLTEADQPGAPVVPSVVKRKVSWPVALVAVMVPGLMVPVKMLITGDEVLGPS